MKSLAVSNLAFATCLVLALFGGSASASPLPVSDVAVSSDNHKDLTPPKCQGCIFGDAETEVISAALESATTKTVEASDLASPVISTSVGVIDISCPGCTFVSSASAPTDPVDFAAYATPTATTDDGDSCPGCIIPSAV
ncbi:hypothetical protein A7U60_g1412 [Sanghuangporus baumii]|uniref:Uncharacterized protein n=1 Tax=Sanghuangporus baumii TaxID=108892 RepID=A0A9Q5I438_SANBA|nr:hypothetical protein A7U60_g1412 [Sanghuangporus baumii]